MSGLHIDPTTRDTRHVDDVGTHVKTFRVPAVLRCLGIPARPITNFSSAHDNTGNLKTDLIFKADGTPDRRHTRDSIWSVQTSFSRVCRSDQNQKQLVSYAVNVFYVFSVGTTTAGTRCTLFVLTCRLDSEDGRWWTPRLRRLVMVGQTGERDRSMDR